MINWQVILKLFIGRGTWHSTGDDTEEYKNFEYMHLNGYVGGATDGVIDEIVGIPMAIKGIYGIVTDEKQREALSNVTLETNG